jgi:integral membrane protein
MYYEKLEKLRKTGIVEGISLIILFFVAMPIKYILHYPIAVTIMGSIHGILWLTFLYILYNASKKNNFSKDLIIKLVILSVVPFGFVLIEKMLKELMEESKMVG